MKKNGWRGMSAVAAATLVMGMTMAPGLAYADSGHGNGHGQGHGHSQHGKQGKQDGSKDHGGDHGHGRQNISGSALYSDLQKFTAYYNPLVLSAEQKLQAEIQVAGQVNTQSSATTGQSVNSSANLAIEQQMQSILTQMASAQSVQQLQDLFRQLAGLAEQLHAGISQSGSENEAQQSLSGAIASSQKELQSADQRYTAIYQQVQDAISGYASNQTVAPSDFGHTISLLKRYRETSDWAIRGLNREDARLSAIVAADGSTTGTPTPPVQTPPSTDPVAAVRSSVSVQSAPVTAGQDFNVSGTVEDANGAVLANIPVVVTFDGKTAQTMTSAQGTFDLSLTPITAIANAPVLVTAGGVTISVASEVGTVMSASPSILSSSVTTSSAVSASSLHQITYTVQDMYGNPIQGETVNFTQQQVVGSSAEPTAEASEAAGSLSASSGVTNSLGQVTVTYFASPTADADADLQDNITAAVPSTSLTNGQAQFSY